MAALMSCISHLKLFYSQSNGTATFFRRTYFRQDTFLDRQILDRHFSDGTDFRHINKTGHILDSDHGCFPELKKLRKQNKINNYFKLK